MRVRRRTSAPPPPAVGRGPWVWPLFALAAVFALREAKALMAPIVVAVVLAFVLAPAVRWLRRRGVPEVLGAGVVVVALVASTVPLAATLVAPAEQWWQKAPATLSQLAAKIDRLRAAVPGFGPRVAAPRGAVAADDPMTERLATEGVALTGKLLGSGAAFAFAAGATVILLYFLLASEHWLLARCVDAIPQRRTRALMIGGLRAAQREIGHYIQVMAAVNVVSGVVVALLLWAVGLPNPTLWGAVVVVLLFIPYLGPMALMALLLLAGVTTFDTLPAMLAPLVVFVAVHAAETNVVSPIVMGRRLSLSPISVFVSVLAWGWLWGVAGALIAVPMLVALRAVCDRVPRLAVLARFLDGERGATAVAATAAIRSPGRAEPDAAAAAPLPAARPARRGARARR